MLTVDTDPCVKCSFHSFFSSSSFLSLLPSSFPLSIKNVIGDALRGATWVSIHNGGGVGWGEVMNGGFGMVLDGTDDADRRGKRVDID